MARPRTHDDALRTRLLEVTSELISTGGPSAVTVRDAARRAGTSASAVYALFGSRDALIRAVTDEAFRRFAGHLAAAPHTDDAGADLLALGLAYRASALDDPHFYRVMFDRPGDGDEEPLGQPTFAVLRDAVARVLGGRSAGGRSATEAALGLWAHVHGLVSLELAGLLPGDDRARELRYRELLAAVGGALLAPPGAGADPAARTAAPAAASRAAPGARHGA